MNTIPDPIAQRKDLITYYAEIIPNPDKMLNAVLEPLPTSLCVNTLKTNRQNCQKILQQLNLNASPMQWNDIGLKFPKPIDGIGRNWAYLAGLYQTQEEVSLIPAILLNPQPGERVLDLCAAPGGKTAQMAVMMQNQGTLIANDRHYGRLRALGHIIKRLGLFNIATTAMDGVCYPALLEFFDRILVDAPCRCEGTLRKNLKKCVLPDREKSLAMSRTQTALLRKAIQLARPGGRVVYSTCTFAPEENERVLHQVIQEFGDAIQIIPSKLAGLESSPGITSWHNETFHHSVSAALRIWPHQNNSGGFFIAVIEKTKSISNRKSEITLRTETPATDPSIAPYINELVKRFNISANLFKNYATQANNHRGIYFYPQSLQIPTNLPIDAAGLFSIKTKVKHPKLSTPAAMWIAPYAKKNIIELSPSQRDNYCRRQTIELTDQQVAAIDSTGYVLVTAEGHGLGLGLYLEFVDGPKVLESLFPKSI